jgi:hypothetical protein
MRSLSLVFACLTLLAANTADAQVYYPPRVPRPVYPSARVYVGSPHHASTAAESYARGYADVVRAQGQYNLLASQALVNLAEARRRETENRVAQTEAYFRMREINRSHRYGDRATQPSRYSITGRKRVTQGAHESKPELTDMRDGHLVWPKALQDDVFESYRAVVERILENQATLAALSDRDRSAVTQASRAMESKLKDRIRQWSPQDYLAAKRFLATLSRLPGAST